MGNLAIKKFLNQSVHNYNEARVLFERYSTNAVLKLLFRSGSSSYHHRRLLSELSELSEIPEPCVNQSLQNPEIPIIPEKPVIPELSDFDIPVKNNQKDNWDSAPDQIKDVIRRKNMHHRRSQHLFIEIGLTEDKDKRLEMTLTLLNDHEQVNACWAVIDAYRETGKILVEKTVTLEEQVDSMSPKELIAASKNIPPNLSKDKAKLQHLEEGHKKAKVLLRYQTNQIKLDLVKKRLEVING
ncbi:hypothetical protein [Sphingobacterium spiritivorum]|uniref:hypothetical protein n=1 Tax=Sphingobacterium spiritivorum TaxID=258 RepID=UPI003DA5DB90